VTRNGFGEGRRVADDAPTPVHVTQVLDGLRRLPRVTGTYGLNGQFTWLGTAKNESRNPNYEALIAPTSVGPVVLQIRDAA
jgi:hypothetical protein